MISSSSSSCADEPIFLVHVSSSHVSFRVPELTSIAKLFGFSLNILDDVQDSGLLLIKLSGKDVGDMVRNAEKLAGRCICIKSIHTLVAMADSYPSLISKMQFLPDPKPWEADRHSTYYIDLKSIGHHVPGARKHQTFASLSFMDFLGKAQMKGAEVTYTLFEDYENLSHVEGTKDGGKSREAERDGKPRMVYMAKLVAEGTARKLIDKFDVKRRAFYGNTSMESEMSLLMANQAMASPEKLIYDPFAGTGSMLYTSAWFGAMVLGSDIDGRQMRGKGQTKSKSKSRTPTATTDPEAERPPPMTPGIYRTAEQYNIRNQILDCITFDVTRCPWRDVAANESRGLRGGWVDAIVTDPPYGVRAGAKRQGRREGKRPELVAPVMLGEKGIMAVNGATGWAHEQPDYIPPFTPYELSNLIYDLLVLSRWLLVKGGRLVFFLPTMTPVGEWEAWSAGTDAQNGPPSEGVTEIPVEIPIVDGMKEIVHGSGSAQDFGRWSRRLITIEKVGDGPYPRPDFQPESVVQGKVPGHHMFRERFFDKSLDGSDLSEA